MEQERLTRIISFQYVESIWISIWTNVKKHVFRETSEEIISDDLKVLKLCVCNNGMRLFFFKYLSWVWKHGSRGRELPRKHKTEALHSQHRNFQKEKSFSLRDTSSRQHEVVSTYKLRLVISWSLVKLGDGYTQRFIIQFFFTFICICDVLKQKP
jgi:hypothetical protein